MLDLRNEPVKSVQNMRPLQSRARLNVASMRANNAVQLQELVNLLWAHGTLQIHFVQKNEERSPLQLFCLKHLVERAFGGFNAKPVRGIQDPHKSIRFFEIVAPKRSKGCLTAHIPHLEREMTIQDCFNIKPQCRSNGLELQTRVVRMGRGGPSI